MKTANFNELPKHHYRVLLADPPWFFSAGTKSRPQHYPRMRDHQLMQMPVQTLAHPDGCWLFMWCTSPKVQSAFHIAHAWGFKFSARGFIWIKTLEHDGELPRLHLNKGFTTRKNAEDCWLFRRGMPKRRARDVHEVIISPVREHSRKPDAQYPRIERYCAGPRLEMFARQARPGWDAYGNQVDKFTPVQEAA